MIIIIKMYFESLVSVINIAIKGLYLREKITASFFSIITSYSDNSHSGRYDKIMTRITKQWQLEFTTQGPKVNTKMRVINSSNLRA